MTTPNAAAKPPAPDICARCGAAFGCGALAGADRCWCMDMPVLDPLPKEFTGCLCPDCLRATLAENLFNRQGAKITKKQN